MSLKYPWGGLIEELSQLEEFKTLLEQRDDLLSYYNRLQFLESVDLDSVQAILNTFTPYDRNYLNSRLLDHLTTVFKSADAEKMSTACEKGYLDVVQFLIDKNVEMKEKAFIYACENNRFKLVEWVLSNTYIKFKLLKSLGSASSNGHAKIVRILLPRIKRTGVPISILDKYLVEPCRFGHLEVVKLLLSFGVGVHFNKDRPLILACTGGYSDIAKLLIEHQADIHTEDDYPIKCACINGHFDIAKLLVEAGARGDSGVFDSPLKYAFDHNRPAIIKLLLSTHHYDLDWNFRYLWQIAVNKNWNEMATVLDEHLNRIN